MRKTDRKPSVLETEPLSQQVTAEAPAAVEEASIIARASGIGVRGIKGYVFKDVSFDIPRGRVTALCGENGSGKTELLLVLAGRMPITTGTLTVDGFTLPRQHNKMRREAGLGFFTNVNEVRPSLRVRALVAAELELYGRKSNKHSTADYIHVWGMDDIADERAENLTAEQRVMFGIALGMVSEPKILVVDDIESDLTQHQGRKMMSYLCRLTQGRDLTVVVGCTEYEIARGADAVVLMTENAAAQREKVEADIAEHVSIMLLTSQAEVQPPQVVGCTQGVLPQDSLVQEGEE